MENDGERAKILLAAIAKRFGPFELREEDVVDNEDGFVVWMSEDDILHVESWDGNESEDSKTA